MRLDVKGDRARLCRAPVRALGLALGLGLLPVAALATAVHSAHGSAGAPTPAWDEQLTTPWADPLRTRPPLLDAAPALPGDARAIDCVDPGQLLATPLELDTAVRAALCHNPQLSAATAAVRLRAAQLGRSRAAFFPTVELGLHQRDSKTNYPTSRWREQSDSLSDTRFATLSWRLYDFGARRAAHRSADATLQSAQAHHDATIQTVLGQVIGSFFEGCAAQAALSAAQTQEDYSEQTLAAAQRREAHGVGTRADTLQAATALARATLERSRAQGMLEKALAALLHTLGLPADTPAPLQLALADHADADDAGASLPEDVAHWLALAQSGHPALQAARLQLDATRHAVQVETAEGMPTLDFTLSRHINAWPDRAQSLQPTDVTSAGLRLTVPLFEGFARTYKVRAAQAQIDVRSAELHDAEGQVQSSVRRAHAEALAAQRNLAASAQLQNLADKAVQSVERRLQQGQSNELELLQARSALVGARLERQRAMAEWHSARLRLASSAGALLGDMLTSD